jgi:parvulin-like peptidyl-prolyl isomerase
MKEVRMPDISIGRILREPLFHFFLLGLGIFAIYGSLTPNGQNDGDGTQIVIDTQDVDRLVKQFEATWRRPPTPEELSSLVEAQLREEILVREAIALGLDQGDAIIRNRLAQKMTFLTTSVAQSMLPEDEILIAHMETNRKRFTMPGQLAFDQISLPEGADANSALAALNAGVDPDEVGNRSLLPLRIPLTSAQAIDATFGRNFYATLIDLPLDAWAGPVQSGYGAHLVRLTDRKEPRLPPLESIRDQVLADWRREQTDALTVAQFDAFRDKYEIKTPTPEALAQWAVK